MYIYVCVHVGTCTHVFVCMCTCMCACVFVYMYVCMWVCVCVCVCVCEHAPCMHCTAGLCPVSASDSRPPGSQLVHVCVTSRFSRVRLCHPVGCGPPGSSVRGILWARVLEWVATAFSRDLPNPGMEPASLTMPLTSAGGFFTTSTTWEAPRGSDVCLLCAPLHTCPCV